MLERRSSLSSIKEQRDSASATPTSKSNKIILHELLVFEVCLFYFVFVFQQVITNLMWNNCNMLLHHPKIKQDRFLHRTRKTRKSCMSQVIVIILFGSGGCFCVDKQFV